MLLPPIKLKSNLLLKNVKDEVLEYSLLRSDIPRTLVGVEG